MKTYIIVASLFLCTLTNAMELILVIKDHRPLKNSIQKKIAINNLPTHTHIKVPSSEILYALLERLRYGYMAMHTQLPRVIGGQELTHEALKNYTKTALGEANNLYSLEELEYHTNKITHHIMSVSSFHQQKAKL